jgi:PAS domain S-box-containing protein
LAILERFKAKMGRVIHLWRQLAEPLILIEEAETQRRAQFLASILLVLTPLGFLGAVLPNLLRQMINPFQDIEFLIMIPTTLFVSILYLLSRTKYYRIVFYTAVIIASTLLFITAFAQPNVTDLVDVFYFLILPTLLAGVFLSIRQAIYTTLINIIGVLLMPLMIVDLGYYAVITGPVTFLVIMTVATLFTTYYRNQIEQNRQERLVESEARYRNLFAGVSDAIIVTDMDFCVVDWNWAAERLYGWQADEVMDKSVNEIVQNRFTSTSREKAVQTLMTTGHWQGEVIQSHRDGTDIPIQASVNIVKDTDGQPVRVISINRDISEQKETETMLRDLYSDLEVRVAERTYELTEANKRLHELDELKSKFIADMVHELRTPVANLNLYVDLLERGNPEKRERYQMVIKEKTQQLVRLTEDILNVSRLDLYTDQAQVTAVPLNDLITNLIPVYQPGAEIVDLALCFEPTTDLPFILGERNQITQVIGNLVKNALNYTHHGMIKIATEFDATRQQVCVKITDTGRGIAADDLPHIFDRFYRGRDVGQLNLPGSGLGLAIAKEIVEMHKGEIVVESEKGQGTTFIVWWPIAAEVKA